MKNKIILEFTKVFCLGFAFSVAGCAQKAPVPSDQTQQHPSTLSAQQIRPNLSEVQEMVKNFAKQYSDRYKLSNEEFLLKVREATSEYAQPGYFDRASAYRDVINVAYARESNLDASLGFVLAMSRSKFINEKIGDNQGLWQMSDNLSGYEGFCADQTLSDSSQQCAARTSAIYMKSLVLGVFDGDVIYSVAAFGKSQQDAEIWKSSLPANRSDVWNSVKTPQERDQIVRFIAAGIVTEDPQKFGLNNDRPLSELFRITMESGAKRLPDSPIGLAAVEKSVAQFLRKISQNDQKAFLTGDQARRVETRIKELKSNSAVAQNINAALTSSKEIQMIATANNLNPQLVAVAAITKLANSRGDVVAMAKSVAKDLAKLAPHIGSELSDDALLMIAALDQAASGKTMKMRNMLQVLATERPESMREIRTIWFLEKEGKITKSEFDRALTFLAIGTITQNPKAFGIDAEAMTF